MSKVVDTVVNVVDSIFEVTGLGALWDSLSPDVPEKDLATLGQGLQKGIDQPRRITFGRDRVGGVIAHQAEVEKGGKKWMQLIVLINGAPIDALEEIYIADKKLTDYPRESWDYSLSDGRQTTANAKAVAKMAGWTSEHVGFGQSYVFIEMENNREVFEDGINDMGFLIRGTRVWDPRDTAQNPDDESTWLWSQNAVLCALHYVRFYGAHEVPFERLPLQWWIAAINVCDEDAEFTDVEGVVTTEPRYTTNGSFTFSSKPLEVLGQLEACFAGKIFRQMGQWYVRVGAWYGEPTYTINADDVHGNIKIKWHADLRERANVVRATFTDPEQNYDRTDAPPVVSAGYQAIDNQILEKSISLPFVRSSTTSQRLATIHLEQTRLGEIELPLKHKGLAAAVGRTVYLNLPGESINNKVYRVTERRFRLDGGVTLMCVEDGPDLWADNIIPGAQDLTPNSDYLVGKPQPVFDVRVTVDGDGNGIIKWTHPTPLAVHEYDVEFINTAANESVFKTSVTYTQVTIPNLQLGEYTARISAKNIFGQRSHLVAVQFSVLTPTLPTVYVTVDYNQITLTANIAAAGIGTAFEWEFLGTAAQPQSGERVLAQIYNRIGLKSETEYKFRVRSVNHLGASDWVNVTATTTTVDLTKYINNVELTQLSPDAQTLIEDMNQQVDRLRPSTENNLPDVLEQTVSDLNLEKRHRQDIEKGVLDLSANYTNWRQEYERRQLGNERLIDAVVYVDPENGLIVNRAFAYTDKEFSEANIKIDGVNARIAFEANRITQTDTRLAQAESELEVQAGQISQRATFTEIQSEIAGAIAALRPAYSWQFNSSDEGFTGVESYNPLGFIVALNPITTPEISYNAEQNPMFRIRVRKHADTIWNGQISVNGGATTITVPEPASLDWHTIQLDTEGTAGYVGNITSLQFDLGQCDIDAIEIGKRGANDLALKDIKTRTTELISDINAAEGIMGQYATTTWVSELGYQTESSVNQILDTFNTTYKVSATLQQFTDNGTLEKANAAQQFINGADAYIKTQITAFNAADGGVNAKFSNILQNLDALNGTIEESVVQIQGLDLALENANLQDVITAAKLLDLDNELTEQDFSLAFAQERLLSQANELSAVAQQTTELTARVNENKALAQEYTRTAVGYCLNSQGNITSENDAVLCVRGGGTWVAGPLAEYIENLQISNGTETASIKQLRQVFETVDGKLVARGGWQIDNNGRAVGVVGYNDGQIGNLDLVGDVIRQGVMVGSTFIPTSYIDNTDPSNPVHIFKGRMELGDGHQINSLEDIKAQDGTRGSVEVDVGTSTGAWSDSTANAALPSAPVLHDRVTIYKSSDPKIQTTKRYTGSIWQAYSLMVHGSALIRDTLDAGAIRSDTTMSAGSGEQSAFLDGAHSIWRIYSGSRTPEDAPFRVDKYGNLFSESGTFGGSVTADKIIGEVASGIPLAYTGFSKTHTTTSFTQSYQIARFKAEPIIGMKGNVIPSIISTGPMGSVDWSVSGAGYDRTNKYRRVITVTLNNETNGEKYERVIHDLTFDGHSGFTDQISVTIPTLSLPAHNTTSFYNVVVKVQWVYSHGTRETSMVKLVNGTTTIMRLMQSKTIFPA
ncbi:phage tail protein [Pseudoalteromonas sp. SK20]|uniref:phage tail protein n=1 Tax=Pseudoalteromonas sp. SK20 TaxID=1938367 RepID=UPI0009763B36|nr:phage tail protein [Pseudoalteromonas sp. SK20]